MMKLFPCFDCGVGCERGSILCYFFGQLYFFLEFDSSSCCRALMVAMGPTILVVKKKQ